MRIWPAIFVFFFLGGCLQTNQLSIIDTEEALLFVDPDIPEVLFADFERTVFDDVERDVYPVIGKERGKDNAVGSFEMRRVEGPYTPLHTLIDSVLISYAMSAHVIETATQRVIRETGMDLTADAAQADYILYLDVIDYGLGADGWESPLFFEVHAELTLVSSRVQEILWTGEVLDIVKVPGALMQQNIPEKDLAAPARMSTLSYEQIKEVLFELGYYTGTQLVKGLIQAYHESQPVEKTNLVAG